MESSFCASLPSGGRASEAVRVPEDFKSKHYLYLQLRDFDVSRSSFYDGTIGSSKPCD